MARLLTLLLALSPALALAQAPESLVDRLSERIDRSLAGVPEGEHLRVLQPAAEHADRAVVVEATFGAAPADGETAAVDVKIRLPGEGPRLLLVDAGAVFQGPQGSEYVPVPNQRFILEAPEQSLTLEALPLWPDKPAPNPGARLTAVWSNDPGLIAVLRTVQRLEAVDVDRVRRYVKEKDGAFVVDTFVDNQDVRLARWMSWSRNPVGRIEARFPRAPMRYAIYAVTSNFTIQETADDLRKRRGLDMQPAIERAGALADQAELLLERAGLNFRVFSPRHAVYHFNQGVAAYRRDDLDAAQAAFDRALQADSGFVDAQYNLGVVLYRKGDYPGARRALLIASGMKGAGADVFYNRGAVLYRMGDALPAARAFRKALALNPRHPDAVRWLEKADPEGVTRPKPPTKKKKKRRRRRRR